jgi:hypothetical protein
MNNYINFKLPEWQEKYGQDWTSFKTIIDEYIDHYVSKITGLFRYNDINTIPERGLEWILTLLQIPFNSTDTFVSKKTKMRYFVGQYRRKGLADVYLDIQENIVGVRGTITSGLELGVWRWGISRWHDGTRKKSDIRWSLAGSQFEIYIFCETTDSDKLDAIELLYRQSSIKPAFYAVYLVDEEYNILRTI